MIRIVPWILAVITAGWFGRMAYSAGRNWVAWTLGGGLFGLVIATIVFGVGHAIAIPFSDQDRLIENIEWTCMAIVVIGLLGWIFTSPLHGAHRTLLGLSRRLPPPAPEPPAAPTPKGKPEPSRSGTESGAGKPVTASKGKDQK